MKRLYLIALFIIVSLAATAQENGNRDAQNRIVRGPYETNRFFDNIFVGVAGGVNIYFGEHDSYGKFGKRMAPALDIHVGKWFTPSIGARVEACSRRNSAYRTCMPMQCGTSRTP